MTNERQSRQTDGGGFDATSQADAILARAKQGVKKAYPNADVESNDDEFIAAIAKIDGAVAEIYARLLRYAEYKRDRRTCDRRNFGTLVGTGAVVENVKRAVNAIYPDVDLDLGEEALDGPLEKIDEAVAEIYARLLRRAE